MQDNSVSSSTYTNYRQTSMLDRCVVCDLAPALKGSPYCSRSCRRIAYNFRKRLMNELAFLKRIGFTYYYKNGVQLHLVMPLECSFAYPPSLNKIIFPEPGEKIVTLNASHFWTEFERVMGPLVGPFIRWVFERGDYPDNELL